MYENSISKLEETRRNIITELIKARYDNQITDNQVADLLDYYLKNLERIKPIFKPIAQDELIDARTMNEEFLNYQFDIHTLFMQLDAIDSSIIQHQKLNESIIENIRIRIENLNKKIEEFDYVFRNEQSVNVLFENFLDYNKMEKSQSFYTDRKGTLSPIPNRALVDTQQNALKLPILYKEDKLINFNGVRLADLKIIKQIGSGFITSQNPAHNIEKAIDSSYETYWSESILTDVPFEVNLGRQYYDIEQGAACELELILDHVSSINEITLTPFSEYPFQVVSILIYDNDNLDNDPYELVSPTATLKEKESTDIISYQFQEVVAKRIRIILNQQHYTKVNTVVESQNNNLLKIWLQEQGHIESKKTDIFKPVIQDHADIAPHWSYLKNYMKNKSIVDEIKDISSTLNTKNVLISKYQYQYGLYNIAVVLNEYHSEGIFVTKPISNRNTHTVKLETKEEHPILEEVGIPITNIEYYVTDKNNPSSDDWISIIPTNQEYIYSERLLFEIVNYNYQAVPRFNIDTLIAVRKNGEKLLPNIDYTTNVYGVLLKKYDPSKIYTIDYRPVPSSYAVNFLDLYTKEETLSDGTKIKRVSIKEVAENIQIDKETNTISLNRYPFIDKSLINYIDSIKEEWEPTYLENIYLPIKVKVTLPDGSIVEQKTNKKTVKVLSIENKTDYYDTKRNLLEIFHGNNYQYRVLDNKVLFNAVLPKGTLINIEYPYLTDSVRLKIIMHRNLHDVYGLTPFLHEYKIITNSIL